MANDEKMTVPRGAPGVDSVLREHLNAIEREETPERLLLLARELQRLLRTNGQ